MECRTRAAEYGECAESVAPYGRASVHRFAAWPQPIGANIMVSITGEVKVNGSFVPEGVATALHTQPPTQDQFTPARDDGDRPA